MRKAIIPLVATAAAQLLVIESIAAAFAFQPKETQLSIAMIPVQADIEQGECIRRDPAPYEPITYHVPLDADLQQYTAEMCDLYEVPLELAYAVMQVESGYTVSATSSTGDYGLMQINSINAGSTTAPWAIYPSSAGGSETTYIPDYSWTSSGWLVLYVGGLWVSGSVAGLFYFYGSDSSSISNSSVGARLLFVP